MEAPTPPCDIHMDNFGTVTPSVAKVRRVFQNGTFNARYYCKSCLREVRHMASKYMFDVEVEMFNRRTTDKLKTPSQRT